MNSLPLSELNRIRFSVDYAEENAKPRNCCGAHVWRGTQILSSA